ncbi:Csu type fimbrial protein [Algiphilus aromaticivorans]|uniref:Csu type fimbrial protein n=1 Tax=Algiphilus aromaticivorans TaxID=382454 RepID=UPI0005C14159|nr:spore coat U domain-containing protein [Algiphilus aromaticivorans]
MKRLLIGSGALLFAGSVAWAATETDTFEVTATVVSACTVTASDLNFGNYDPLAALPTDATTTVSVTCSLLAPYDIGLNAGLHGGAVTSREMQISGDTDRLDYLLSQDLAHTTNWGNTVDTDTVAGVGTGLSVPTTIYGRIPAAQNVPVGSYADTITVTVTF